MADAMTADQILDPNGDPIDLEDAKNFVVRFCLTAGRKARRAALYTGENIWSGVKVVGRGVKACLPYVGYVLLAAAAIAMIYALAYLNLLFIQFAFTVNPVIGWTLTVMTAMQVVSVVVGGCIMIFRYFTE